MPLSVRAQQLVSDGDSRAETEAALREEYGEAAVASAAADLDRLFAGQAERRAAMGDATGWMVKKAAKVGRSTSRYFVLKGSRVSYFANEANGTGVDQKGLIDLTPDAVIGGEGPEITIRLPGRVWELQARTALDAQAWRQSLRGM